MRILILTQNESLYLPTAIASICRARRDDIASIVVAPAMSTHGGPLRGLLRHVCLFGLTGTLILAWRVLGAKLKGWLHRPGRDGPFYSLRAVAKAFGIPYHVVTQVNSEQFHAIIDAANADLLVSMSCPQIIGKRVRKRFAKGCINVHGAPLPRYRGLMPAFWAPRNGEIVTGVTVHDLADKLDDGEILLQRNVAIVPEDTWDSLVRKTKTAGAKAIIEAIDQIERGIVSRRQNTDAEATYFSFPTAADRKAFRKAGRRFF